MSNTKKPWFKLERNDRGTFFRLLAGTRIRNNLARRAVILLTFPLMFLFNCTAVVLVGIPFCAMRMGKWLVENNRGLLQTERMRWNTPRDEEAEEASETAAARWFPNYAGRDDVDDALAAELETAGITVERLPEILRSKGEVKTIVAGTLHGWTFKRAWRYWIATGPGIPCHDATHLHHWLGTEVRVDGHAGCPSPREWFHGLAVGAYHVDTQRGLNALATTIRRVVETNNP